MNRYIAFLKVFERNSFSDAARDLGYTQSAVSQMIMSLERLLNQAVEPTAEEIVKYVRVIGSDKELDERLNRDFE